MPDERPKLKDFGSSLKRLKWDADKQAAVIAPYPEPWNRVPASLADKRRTR
jgi:hypothetical protein